MEVSPSSQMTPFARSRKKQKPEGSALPGSCRMVAGLLTAFLSEPPRHPVKRLRGAKARGLTFERKFIRFLKRSLPQGVIYPNQWIKFLDANGRGYAQPDVFLLFKERIVLFECKLTENLSAQRQLLHLYEPLLFHIYARPVVKIQVCKNLRSGLRRIEISSLPSAIQTKSSSVLTWQWLP